MEPDDAEAHNNLGLALRTMGERDEALRHFQAALRARPEWPVPMNETAWILATHPDERIRNPGEAVRLAEGAAERTARRQPVILDTLAAAYAAAGRIRPRGRHRPGGDGPRGVRRAPAELADEIGRRLELYRQRKPFRESSRKTTPPQPGPHRITAMKHPRLVLALLEQYATEPRNRAAPPPGHRHGAFGLL